MDTVTRTFPVTLTSNYVANSIIELSHFRDMTFDNDERVGVYLESFFCNLNLKSFNLGIIADFDGDESEAEKMAKFSAAEAKSQKVGLRILTRKNNIGDWSEKAEIILVNRGRKDYFDLLQPYLAKYQVRIFEKNDALAIQLIDYGNGLLTPIDSLGIEAAFTITISKKNDLEALQAQVNTLQLAIDGKLQNINPNHFLGREINSGVIQQIPFTRFATQAQIDQAIIDLVGGAPGALNTLKEIAAALNDDANFAATVTNTLASKAPLNSPVFTGFPTIGELAFKCKSINGVTATQQGESVALAHNLNGAKIVALIGVCQYIPGSGVFLSSSQTGFATHLSYTSTAINVLNVSGQSSGILSKPITVVIFYIA